LEKGFLEQVGIRTSAALEFFAEHFQRKADHSRALWTLLVLAEWLDWVATETDCSQTEPGVGVSQSSSYADETSSLLPQAQASMPGLSSRQTAMRRSAGRVSDKFSRA
jgi:hypothetical protein